MLSVLPLFVTVAGLWLLLRSGLAARMAVDQPNHRSLHAVPVPRIGGLVMVPAFLIAWTLYGDGNVPLLLLVAALALISCLDDRFGLPVFVRFAGHAGAALWFVMLQPDLNGIALIVAAMLCIIWGTNLFNFMDGSDGMAGGMALFGFLAYALVAALNGNDRIALLCWPVAAAAAGFLIFNFHPAKTFMGDAGSIPLGFLMGAIGLLGWRDGLWPLWFPLLVFSPFVVDATVTLFKRLLRGERFWQAHRDHYYQRLIRMGWSHRRLALSEYALMAAVGASALVMLNLDRTQQFVGLVLWVSLYAAAMMMIDMRWKRHQLKAGKA